MGEDSAHGPSLVNSNVSLWPSTRAGTSPKRQRVDSDRDHPFTRWRFGLVRDWRGHFPIWAHELKDHPFTRWRFGLVRDWRGHFPIWAHEPKDHPFTRWRFGLVRDWRGHFPIWAHEPKILPRVSRSDQPPGHQGIRMERVGPIEVETRQAAQMRLGGFVTAGPLSDCQQSAVAIARDQDAVAVRQLRHVNRIFSDEGVVATNVIIR